MPERKTLNEDLFYRGSSANLPRLHTCKNKVPFWDFSQFAVTLYTVYVGVVNNRLNLKNISEDRWRLSKNLSLKFCGQQEVVDVVND